MSCRSGGDEPNGATLRMLNSEYSYIQRTCKKLKYILDQYYLTGNVGAFLEKGYGVMKGCILDHLFFAQAAAEVLVQVIQP